MTASVWDRISGVLAKAPGAHFFEGARPVARREFMANVKSVRMVVVTALLFLVIVGGAAGFSALAGGFGGGAQTGPFLMGHVVWPNGANGSADIVVFACDVWGTPRAGLQVALFESQGPNMVEIDMKTTGADGNARFTGLSTGQYMVAQGSGGRASLDARPVYVAPSPEPFTADGGQVDAAGNGSSADIILHALNSTGQPLTGTPITMGGNVVATFDGNGFAHIVLPPGEHQLEITYGGGQVAFTAHVSEPQAAFIAGGANVVMLLVASGLIPFILPMMTIAMAHDAIARERVQGSLDAMLSRPTTRYGVLLGKFLGVSFAMLIPVIAAVSVGAVAIGSISGKGIDGGFFGVIIVAMAAYVAAYTLLLLILSTLAKTTGTAIMFGVLLWLLYNFLWGLLLLIVTWAAGLGPGDRAYYDVTINASLFNLNDLYTAIIGINFPGNAANPFTFQGQELIPAWGPPVAYAVWLVVLFVLALWIFDRKASE